MAPAFASPCANWSSASDSCAVLDWKMWPRQCAVAEALWTVVDRKDYGDFQRRLRAHVKNLRVRGVNCAEPVSPSDAALVRDGVWSDAIDQALKTTGRVFLSPRDEPYLIDRPIMLKSGQSLVASVRWQEKGMSKPCVSNAVIRFVASASTAISTTRTCSSKDAVLPAERPY